MANRNERIQQELTDLLNRWSAEIAANDAAAIGKFMSDDWVIIGETGVTERGVFLGLVESGVRRRNGGKR